MKALKQAILTHGSVKSDAILNVSDFLNMQVDVELMKEIGKAFADHFKDDSFDVYITVEASGIAPAVFASLYSNKPLIIIKKLGKQVEHFVQQPCYSYTKKEDYYLSVDKKYLEGKRCILIDDFLASGSVVENVNHLCEKAEAQLIKTGICISKDFQEGVSLLKTNGYDVISLARIKKMDPVTGSIEFIE